MKLINFKIIFFMLSLTSLSFAQDTLSLSHAIEYALGNNYDVRIQKLDEKAASIQNSWAEAGALPSLDFSLSGTRTRDMEEETDSDRYAGGLTLNWMLFDGFSVIIQKSRLDHLEKLSEGNTMLLMEQTVQGVILAYYNVLLQERSRDVLDTLRQLSNDRYRRAEAQRELGSLATYDLLQAKNAWLEDEAGWLSQVANARNALRDLNFLMGESGDVVWYLSDPFKAVQQTFAYNDMLEKLKSDNRLLRNQYLQQTLVEKNHALRISDFSPSLSLSAGTEKTGDSPSLSDSWYSYGTLSLSWNLFSGGDRLRALQVAKLDKDIGEIEIQSMMHSLSNQLGARLETYNVRKKLLDVANEAQKTAELNLQISEEKYKSGAINSFNYRDVQLIYLNSALSRLRSVYNLLESETELLRMTGGILSQYHSE